MEPAAKLQKKKTSIQKGQLKRTIKNILCRPDPQSWPIVSDEEAKILDKHLQKHKVVIPDFKKPHWEKLKHLSKDQRPKPPKLQKIKGLTFGIAECSNALNNKECSAIILESTINPRAIVQSITELCVTNKIPYICLKDLRHTCLTYFGIPTACLGLKSNCFPELAKNVCTLSMKLNSPKTDSVLNNNSDINGPVETVLPDIEMSNVDTVKPCANDNQMTECPYLYRKDNKTRIFVPIQDNISTKPAVKFAGQDYIIFDKNSSTDSKTYQNMLLKRIGNNPNRKSGKVKRKKNK